MNKRNISEILKVLRALEETGITTIPQALLLFTAAEIGCDVTMSELTRRSGLAISTASRVAWDLQESGWLKYAPHPTDRRKTLVTANLKFP